MPPSWGSSLSSWRLTENRKLGVTWMGAPSVSGSEYSCSEEEEAVGMDGAFFDEDFYWAFRRVLVDVLARSTYMSMFSMFSVLMHVAGSE
jgi:hypothetical protein